MGRTANRLDQLVAADLSARYGVVASARTIERLREYGFLPTRTRSGLGRGQGSRAVAGGDEVERALLAMRLKEQHGSWQRAALAFFVDGRYPIAKAKLERLYALEANKFHRALQAAASTSADHDDVPSDLASRLTRPLSRSVRLEGLRRRLRASVWTPAQLRQAVYETTTELLTVLRDGRPATSAGFRESLRLHGVPESQDSTEPPTCSIDETVDQVRQLSYTQLTVARDALKALRFAAQRGTVSEISPELAAHDLSRLAEAPDLEIAFSTPGTAVQLSRFNAT